MSNYLEEAQSDARAMLDNFMDEIIEQAQNGEISTDFNNDFHDGDSYHHENHVDKDYNLTTAADLLDQLSDHEETDSGLWQGLEPRQAIVTQAAYTYGNAVAYYWQQEIEKLNEIIDEFDDSCPDYPEYKNNSIALIVYSYIHLPDLVEFFPLAQSALDSLPSLGTVAVLADQLEEGNKYPSVMKSIREKLQLITEAHGKQKKFNEWCEQVEGLDSDYF